MKAIFKKPASNLTKKTGSKSATGASKVKKNTASTKPELKPAEKMKAAMKGTTK